jgi:Cytochrome c554 and c-prime
MLKFLSLLLVFLFFPLYAQQSDYPAGDELLGVGSYDNFENPRVCGSCHVDIYQQWIQAMMSQSYTHHWDEIEYFKLAVPHARKEERVSGVKAGCNGCHAFTAFYAGDVPPPDPAENSRANEGVSCDVCHSITGFKGDVPHNYNFTTNPGRTKYGNRPGLESPHHNTQESDFIKKAEFCGVCHNEKSPGGVWVKSTQLEWSAGPYSKEGVQCQDCHMPPAAGRNAQLAEERPDMRQHLFHGAHSQSKLRGAVELRMHPDTREIEPGLPIVLKVQAFNHKVGHKIPSGSAEERQLWLTVIATDAAGKQYHLPVDKKGFEGEEYTISSKTALAYQDIGEIMELADFKGLLRDDLPYEGDRIFRLPYFDPQNRMTIAQWNTVSLGTDYRIGPRETKVESYTWEIPDDIAEGRVKVEATIYYRKLVKSVGDFLEVPAEEMEPFMVNKTETWFEVYY